MKLAQTIKYQTNALAFAVLLALSACGNKSSDSQPVPTTVVNPQCLGCQNINGAAFFQAESQDWYGTIKINWSFMGQTQIQPQINPYNQQNGQPNVAYQGGYTYPNSSTNYGSPVTSYVGPVAAQGIMTVLQGMNLGYCQLPQGTYNLSTLSPGQWSGFPAVLTNLRLQANGPGGIITLSVPIGQVSAKTGSQLGSTWSEIAPIGRIFANLMVESVNGYQCGTSILVQ